MKKLLIPAIALVGLVVMTTAFTSPGSGPGAAHVHPPTSRTAPPQQIAPLLASARLATAKYATNLRRAKRDGYTTVVTQHMPDMGWHFMNPSSPTST